MTVGVGNEAVARRTDVAAVLGRLFIEQRVRVLHRVGDRLKLHVGDGDLEPFQRRPGGDVAAHGAGADDMDAPDLQRLVFNPRLALLLLLQQEDAAQIARGDRTGELHEQLCLGVHQIMGQPVLLEQID